MQIKTIFFLLLQAVMLAATAQQTEKISIKAGEDITAVLSTHGMYRFPAFITGTVYFKNGGMASAKMNYHTYLGLIQFISPKGDTLALAHPETIDSISIDSNLFYYRKDYFQVMSNNKGYQVAMQQKIEFRSVKIGAMGIPANGTSIDDYQSLLVPGVNSARLVLNEDITVVTQKIYFLFYKKYRQEEASYEGFSNAFPGHQKEIRAFIKANHTAFGKLEDLEKLTAFCVEMEGSYGG